MSFDIDLANRAGEQGEESPYLVKADAISSDQFTEEEVERISPEDWRCVDRPGAALDQAAQNIGALLGRPVIITEQFQVGRYWEPTGQSYSVGARQ